MRKNNIPEWYIWSCNKAEYLFPKAHAVAYVLMAFRIAYFKVHFPIEFYLAYLAVKADEFDAQYMLNPKNVLKRASELEKNPDKLSHKEKGILSVLEVVREMNKRGIFFSNVDIYKSDMKAFLLEEGKILPPLNSIPGLGNTIAESIVRSRVIPFKSREDLQKRASVNKTNMEILEQGGCLIGLPNSDQVSLFDFI